MPGENIQCSLFAEKRFSHLIGIDNRLSTHFIDFSWDLNPIGSDEIINCILLISLEEFREHGKKIWTELKARPELNTKIIILSDEDLTSDDKSILPSDLIFAILPTNLKPHHLNPILSLAISSMELEIKNVQLQSSLYINTMDIRRITTVGQALAVEHDFGKLIELILLKARELTAADGGSIYLAEKTGNSDEPTHLRFMKSVLLLDADEFLLPIDAKSIAGYVALTKKPLLIEDVHELPSTSEYNFNSEFDRAHNYHTKSMMTIPMTNPKGEIIGVIQLINRKKNFNKVLTLEEMQGSEVIPFSEKDYEIVSSMAGQAAVAIENQRLLNDQKTLLESFIQLIAGAIDAKSPYTGAHCERVPILTMMLAEAACQSKEGVFKYFDLNEEERYELKIASWLHDCGKVTTPVHVMDKATKLETIFDRIELVKARLEIYRKQLEVEYLKKLLSTDNSEERKKAEEIYKKDLAELNEMEELLIETNYGGEFLADETIEKIQEFAKIQIEIYGKPTHILTKNEVENLCIRKGTLTTEERLIINGHMVETVKMLEALPFPSNLKRVPEYACGHHEKMDGKGYPKGLYGGDMSIPARIMAIADVFEALTAQDRPYKKGKTLSETMRIMGFMKQDNHLDPDILDLFITSGVYKDYARKFLPLDLIDEVDEESILSIKPKPYSLPSKPERDKRWGAILPEYQAIMNQPHQSLNYHRDEKGMIVND